MSKVTFLEKEKGNSSLYIDGFSHFLYLALQAWVRGFGKEVWQQGLSLLPNISSGRRSSNQDCIDHALTLCDPVCPVSVHTCFL